MEQLINNIIEARASRLPAINDKIQKLNSLLAELEDYETLRSAIVDEKGELRVSSPLYPQLVQYPDMVANINEAQSDDVQVAIRKYIGSLERLHQRFARKSVAIQVFGEAGSGKSTFIQSVTGLDNNVVLVSSGDHCTGATSFIKNSPYFEARIIPYTKAEILQIFNDIIREYQSSATTEKPMQELASFYEIKDFNVDDYGLKKQEALDAIGVYVDHFDTICKVLDKIEREGEIDPNYPDGKFLRLTDPKQVQQYVAQHNGGSDRGEQPVLYYNFLAVKYVRIFKDFNYKKAGNIEIMDSVGFGDARTENTVKNNMCQSVADTCDIVVVLSAPVSVREYSNCCKWMDDIHYDEKGGERIAKECLFMVLNRRESGARITSTGCQQFMDKWLGRTEGAKARREVILQANLSNPQETEQNVIIPILKQVTGNLEQIDENIRLDVEREGKKVYDMFSAFIKKVSNVLLGNFAATERVQLRRLYRDIYLRDLRPGFDKLLQEAKLDRDSTAINVRRELTLLCNEDSLARYLNEIESVVDRELEYTDVVLTAYNNAANTLRHTLPNKFRCIDIPLQEEVEKRKSAIFKLLLTTGRWNAIMSADNLNDYKAINAWMQNFNDTVLDSTQYPILHKLVEDLLNFKIDIDGFLLYRVIRHLDTFENNLVPNERNPQRQKQAIMFYLKTNLHDAFSKIREDLNGFTQAPNDATYFALEEFKVGFMLYPECDEELFQLYSTYQNIVWRSEFENIASQEVALEEWSQKRNELEKYRSLSVF